MDDQILASLERWLEHEKRPVTARLLATKHKIHVDKARSHMVQFYHSRADRKREKPNALWMVKGQGVRTTTANGSQDASQASMDIDGGEEVSSIVREAILLVDDERLEHVKARFASEPPVALYALSPHLPEQATSVHKIAALTQLSTIQHDLKNTLDYVKAWEESHRGVKLGAIRPSDDITHVGKASALNAGIVKQESTEGKQLSSAQSKGEKPTSSAAASTKKAGTLSFAKSKKPEPKAEKKEVTEEEEKADEAMQVDEEDGDEDDGPIGYADEKADKIAAVPPEEGGAPYKRADAGSAKSEQEEKRRRQKQELMDMMDEDLDGNADPEVVTGSSTSTSMMGPSREEKKAKQPLSSKKESGGSRGKGADGKESQDNPVDTLEPKEKRKVRKQRKITRKETTRDDKGYRVTRDVDAYESYSSFESSENEESTKKTKKATASRKGKGDQKRGSAPTEKEEKRESPTSVSKEDPKESETTSVNKSTDVANEAKPSSAPAPAPAPPAAKKAASGGSGQQKLSSFFTRKG